MASWNDSSDYCNWRGITCDPFTRRVTVLDLKSQKLLGSLTSSIGNLSFLTGLNLRNNGFRGEIPQENGFLSRLKHLNLTYNMFTGLIPSNISNCTDLSVLAVESNQLSGKIPFQLSSLSQLQYLGLGSNNLTGGFPFWIANFSSRFLGVSLALNNLQGSIPPEIGVLSGLRIFQVYGNQFSGELPSSVYNISSMRYFSVTQNRLHGEIPPDIGLKFPVLEVFAGGVNNFTGRIPDSLSNASGLQVLDFAENRLTGTVPSGLGRLPFLYRINFDDNNLGNAEKGDMDFLSFLTNCSNLQVLGLSTNFFGGEFPRMVANLSTRLEILTLGGNQMHGSLPFGIGNLINLTLLGIEGNYLTGIIPEDIGKLGNLGELYLTGNELTGKIPFSFGNLTKLSVLKLDSNRLQGSIPSEIGNCSSLLELNLSSNNLTGMTPKEVMSLSSLSAFLGLARNSLSGSLPIEVSRLVNLKEFDVSDNKLSGEVPGSLGSCLSLEILLMGGNRFNGSIPRLEALRGLEVVDFSNNNLSGTIPQFLDSLPFVKKLDLSNNDLEGEVSNRGIFSNASVVSVLGNKRLCGGAPILHLPPCSKTIKKSGRNHNLKLIISVTVSVVVSLVLLLCSSILVYLVRKPRKQPSSNDLQSGISYQELYRSTNGFSSDNLIGSGSFGSVYRGVLGENGSPVAIKVLNLKQKGATKSFDEECMILRSVRHRNLLKIMTVCSSSDHHGNEFKCLVSELMPNGNLDEWLHPRNSSPTKTLNLVQRLNIAIDVANAIDYLHNHCHVPIIHCDLKPSNILLDEHLTPRVADFGLSKFILQEPNTPLTHHGVSAQLKGSIGYIPPEYGASSQISTFGDVYSYGILVLELFTGKRPTDDMFNDGLNVHTYVAKALPDHVTEVLDPSLILEEGGKGEDNDETGDILAAYRSDLWSSKMDHLVSVMKIGVSCSMPQAKYRMPISVAVNQLQAIKDLLICRAGKSKSQKIH
ncbi:hypothetical protein ACS0TY_015500 [Phlomoides rotata]